MRSPAVIHTGALDVVLIELSTPADDDAYLNGIRTSEAHLMRFEPGIVAKYPTLVTVREARRNTPPDKLRLGIWALGVAEVGVYDDEFRAGTRPGRFAGSINATTRTDGVEIGYWRTAERVRRGCITLAAQALAAEFSGQGERVYANVIPENLASMAVLMRTGFERDPDADGAITHSFTYNPALAVEQTAAEGQRWGPLDS